MFHLTPVVVAMVNASLVDEVDEPFSTYTVMFNIYSDNILKYRKLPTLPARWLYSFFRFSNIKNFRLTSAKKYPNELGRIALVNLWYGD